MLLVSTSIQPEITLQQECLCLNVKLRYENVTKACTLHIHMLSYVRTKLKINMDQ